MWAITEQVCRPTSIPLEPQPAGVLLPWCPGRLPSDQKGTSVTSPPAGDQATRDDEPCQKCQVYPNGTVYRTRCICPTPPTPQETLRAVAGLGGAIGDALHDLLARVAAVRALHAEIRVDDEGYRGCVHCGGDYPCDTLQALDGPS